MRKIILITTVASTLVWPTVQQHSQNEYSDYRTKSIKDAFQFGWDGYYHYAFPNDELLPVSNGSSNSRNAWGATAIDALSTSIIMELQPVVSDILDYVPTIDFSRVSAASDSQVVSLFETTIRYLGGMISAYDLLKGPYKHLITDSHKIDTLLRQAENLASNLSYAFDTSSGVPNNNVLLNKRTVDNSVTTNGLATTGTLVLEWQRLSDLTGNPSFGQLAQKAESYLLSPSPPSMEPFPGLVGEEIDIKSGRFLSDHGSWSGGSDSFYEYLLKMYIYDANRFVEYGNRWTTAVRSSRTYLASHPVSRPDITFLAGWNGRNLINQSQHLTCFDGGNIILGGLVQGASDIVDFGLELVEGCHETYKGTSTGIGPETFSWNTSTVPVDQVEFFQSNGFYIVDGQYILRPEVIESYYYAYRATKDQKYQNWAWDAFKAINTFCRTQSGFSSIGNVNAADGGSKNNLQESFFFAETLKYLYLIFSGESEIQIEHGGNNKWVFNTEAHPFRVVGPPI